MNRRSVVVSLSILCALAFALRLGTVIYQKGWLTPNAMEHRSIAFSLVNGQGFSFGDWGYYGPTSVQSPPYPLLLATLFKIFAHGSPVGDNTPGVATAYFVAMLINCIGGAGLVWLMYFMTRTLGGSAIAAVVAAGLVAVWPTQIYIARHVQAVELITCATVASVALFYRAVRSGSLGAWVGFSVVFAIATLTEPVFLPSLVISGLLVLLWPRLTLWERFRNELALAIVLVVIIGPWTMRNRIIHGKFQPVKSTFWVNVWKGNNDSATGTDRLAMTDEQKDRITHRPDPFNDAPLLDSKNDAARQYDMLDQSQRTRLHNQPEMVRESVFKEFASGWVASHPQHYLKLCGIRLLKTLTIDLDNPKSYNSMYIASRYTILAITVVGLYAAWRLKWSLLWPGIIAGTALVTYTLTVTAARFSLPFEPLQLCLGTAALDLLLQHRNVRQANETRGGFSPVPPLSATSPAGQVA